MDRTKLRTRLVRAMVGTLAVVFGATLLTVGYLNVRSARETQNTIEAQIRQSITRKGQGLAANQALALRGLVGDNAFSDVRHLVERTVHQDREMVYGLFMHAEGRPWVYVPPAAPAGAPPVTWREIGIVPGDSLNPETSAQQRVVRGETIFEFSAPVDAEDGTVLGRIFYGLSSVPLDHALSTARGHFQRSLALTLLLLGALGVAAMLLGVAIIQKLSRRITGPLAHLTTVIAAVGAGNKDERVNIATDDEIGALGRAFNRMLEELDDYYRRLETLNHTLEQRVDERTAELGQRNQDMRLVLDNVNQGFLTISRSGHLAKERSSIVDTWFGPLDSSAGSSTGPTFWDYLARLDPRFAEMFQLGFEALLEDVLPVEVCLHQLPESSRIGDREFSFGYRLIGERNAWQGMLIVVNDVTEQVLHARHEAEQSDLLALLRGFTRDRTGFLSFFEEGARILESLHGAEGDLVTRKRLYHTLKGIAGQAGLRSVAELCHRAEDRLGENDATGVAALFQQLADRWRGLEEALAGLVRERGRDVLDVHASDLEGVLVALRDVAPATIWQRMADWRLEPTRRPLTRLGDYARSLAVRLGRGDLDVSIDDGGVRLDPDRWGPLWSELVHIVRNAVDHGLEPIAPQAPPAPPAPPVKSRPRLRLSTRISGGRLEIEIEDNGRGIDWAAVRQAASARGLRCETVEDLTEALLTQLLTTREAVTATSGRGVGLSAVSERVRALGGRIDIATAAGQGTTFRLTLPLESGTLADRGKAEAAAPPSPQWM